VIAKFRGVSTSTHPSNAAYKRTSSEKFFLKGEENRKHDQERPNARCGRRADPAGAGPDEGIGFRYAPKRYALRAPLGLRSSRRPHPVRETESKRQKQLFGNSIAELDAHNFHTVKDRVE